MNCPLCGSATLRAFAPSYLRCAECELTFLEPAQRPSPEAEKARYDEHRNDPSDAGYREFLAQLAEPLAAAVPTGSHGLDFGSGPVPVLAMMLRAAGLRVSIYDPYYAPDIGALGGRYDFIACSEVAEHLFHPGAEFERLGGLLRPGGVMGVMTEPLEDEVAFERWHYRRDPTHVCFYRPATMEWLGRRHGWEVSRPSRRVTLFRATGSRS
jgi:hypothetical protein